MKKLNDKFDWVENKQDNIKNEFEVLIYLIL